MVQLPRTVVELDKMLNLKWKPNGAEFQDLLDTVAAFRATEFKGWNNVTERLSTVYELNKVMWKAWMDQGQADPGLDFIELFLLLTIAKTWSL